MVLESRIKFCFIPILLLCLLYSGRSSAQINKEFIGNNFELNWQISLNIGAQMSGIKSEDFVSSNYSPLLDASLGKWFAPSLALQFGYRGWYFNLISDEQKHYYGYYFGEALLNIKALIKNYPKPPKWSFYLHAGSGYFYNYDYDRPNICAHLGVSNNYRVSNNLQTNLGLSAIFGWDIYQGDEDILPGLSIGVSYLF